MVSQIIDKIPFKLKEFHDFSFLSKYGIVFYAYDQHDMLRKKN